MEAEPTGKWRVLLVASSLIVVSQPIFLNNGTGFSASLLALAILALTASQRRVAVPATLVLFAIWAMVSVLWTHDRAGYPYAAIALVGTLAVGGAIATYTSREILRGLVGGAGFALVVSAALGFAAPSVGRTSTFFQANALIGIYSNKNSLATVLVIGVAAALGALVVAQRRPTKLGLFLFIAASFAVLIDTRSSSGLVVAGALVVGYFIISILAAMNAMARLGILPLVAVAVGGFFIPWAFASADRFAEALGRDLTLTGRTEIWRIVIETIAREPVFGYGWGGVWGSEVGQGIQSSFGDISANSAHQGFLEITLQLGIVGLILYLAAIVPVIARSFRLGLRSRQHTWILIVLASLVIYNFSEARAAQPIGLFIAAVTAGAALRAAPKGGVSFTVGRGSPPDADRGLLPRRTRSARRLTPRL